LPRGLHAQAGTNTVNLGKEVSMGMLAERVDHVIGVDTHRDSHSAAVCNPSGAVAAEVTLAADAFGYKRLLRFAREQAPGRRVWAIEGTGSFGAGLTSFLLEQGAGSPAPETRAQRLPPSLVEVVDHLAHMRLIGQQHA